MRYPQFYEMYKDAIKNTWTVDEVDLNGDLADLPKLSSAEYFLVKRLIAFFATGDSIVGNNLVLNLYKHINASEARLYLSRQLYEEALHVQFYLTLLDTYITDHTEREDAFKAIDTVESIRLKGEFAFKWMDSIFEIKTIQTTEQRRQFLMNLICFATCIEGLFFFAAFAYVYFLRSKGLLDGLATGTNWVFRDESCHIEFAMEVISVAIKEEPELFDDQMKTNIRNMLEEAIQCETVFAKEFLDHGIVGLSEKDMTQYLQYVADMRLKQLGLDPVYNTKNPFLFMELQDVQELTNFFERRVSSYQVGVEGQISFDDEF